MSDSLLFKANNVLEKIREIPWIPESIEDTNSIPKGDMPGDVIHIKSEHIQKAELIFPKMLELLISVLSQSSFHRAVVSVYGGSGVGKSEIASLLSYYLNQIELGSYTLSGDNYPLRIPKDNDTERLRIFRQNGIKGLISYGLYCSDWCFVLRELQKNGRDFDPELISKYPWLSVYQSSGRNGLKNYLGTVNEIDFNEINSILCSFKNGDSKVYLKRMGREESEFWYDLVDFTNKNIIIIEWTHGNSHNLLGVDIPIFLYSTPQQTLEHRKSRNRDKGADSPFTNMVLGIEQELLNSQAARAKLIVSKDGKILSYGEYIGIKMAEYL